MLTSNNTKSIVQAVDEIETIVFEHLKPYEFKKFGRTIHRFVSVDISQVISFQIGVREYAGGFWVNIGIRIPECSDRISPLPKGRKYYHEYDCTIRTRLGSCKGKADTWYKIGRKSPKRIVKEIINEIDKDILPAFDVLNSREAILSKRRNYPHIDSMGKHAILLDECMIYLHMGDKEKAITAFETYYKSAVDEYNCLCTKGRKEFLKKGESIAFMNQVITADHDGYYTIYGASHAHIDYLDELAEKLGLRQLT